MAVAAQSFTAMPMDLRLLAEALDPAASLPARLDALEDIARWTIDLGGFGRLRRPAPLQIARLQQLVEIAEAEPAFAHRLSATFASVLRDTNAVSFFADAGIPGDRGFTAETIDRIAHGILPQAPDDGSLDHFVSRVFRRARDCAWIDEVPVELFGRLANILGDVFGALRPAMEDAAALLCTRVSSLGLSSQLRELGTAVQVRDSAFFRIAHVPLEHLPMVIAECRHELGVIHGRLESEGVSVDVVFRMDSIRRMLVRIERLTALLVRDNDRTRRLEAGRALLGKLTNGRIADTSIRQLGRQNLALLARKMIERVGHSGEHYITSSKREWFRMLVSAAGGGALTALTVIGKFFVKWQHFAPFLDAVMTSAVYAGSFLAMQFLGLTLATKQPSMTAAALARTIHSTTGKQQLDELVAMIAKMCRSQFAAAMGNVFTVIPVAFVIDLLWTGASGHHFLDAKTSAASLASFDPLHSGTIFFAALTGVLLWLSSLGAGWFENWVTYSRLPDALRHHPIGRYVGRSRMQKLGDAVATGAAGFGGNVMLGVLLAVVPIAGNFLGVPLEVRHITLSTGSIAFSTCTLGLSALTLAPVIGIAIIGILNFGVSFVCALAVALQARDVGNRERLGLAVAVGRRFVRHPLEFFFPVGATANGSGGHHLDAA